MTAALLLDTETDNQDTEIAAGYAQRHPLQIAVCLRNLVARRDFITVEFGNRQIVTQLLDVDSRNAKIVFDCGATEMDNHALPGAAQLLFRSLPGGIRTEFMTGAASQIVFEGRPAFEVRFPALLHYVQRREYFRVNTPVLDPYTAAGSYAEGGSFRLELQDVSLGGVALRTADPRFASLETGSVLRDVTLQLGQFGMIRLDLEIVAPRSWTTPKGDRRYVIGCKFVKLPGTSERTLQRLVTQLETRRQTLESRA